MKRLIISLLLTIGYAHSALAMEPLDNNVINETEQANLNEQLIDAARRGDIAETTRLLDANANVNAQNKDGITPLMIAARNDHALACKLLINKGAIIETQDSTGMTALHHAAAEIKEAPAACKVLLDAGANVFAMTKNYIKVMSFATFFDKVNTTKAIITHALFNPIRTTEQRTKSHEKTFTTICTLNRFGMRRQKDVRHLILAANPILWLDACNGGLCVRSARYDLVHLLPLKRIRALINCGSLNLDETVQCLKAHHLICLRPLMQNARRGNSLTINDEMKKLLTTNNLEMNLGEEIEQNIRRRLTPDEAIQGLNNNNEPASQPIIQNPNNNQLDADAALARQLQDELNQQPASEQEMDAETQALIQLMFEEDMN